MTGPTTAVIGAGISGLTSSKMLSDYGIDHTCFEASDRIGGNWAFGNPNGHSSAYRSLHIDTSKERLSFRDFPMPENYPDFPHHTQIKDYLESYAEAFDLKHNIEFRTASSTPTVSAAAAGRSPTRPAPFDSSTTSSSPTGTTGTRGIAEFPGEFTGRTLHSHHYIDPRVTDRLLRTADPRRRARQQRRRHRRRALVEGAADHGDPVDALRCVDRAEVRVRQAGRHDVPHNAVPTARLAAQDHADGPADERLEQRAATVCPAQPQVLRGSPHPVGRAAAPPRLGRRHPEAERHRLDGCTVHFEDGTSDDFDVIVATGYNITFPFFDPDFISAPDNHLRSTSGSTSPASTTSRSWASHSRRRRCSRSSSRRPASSRPTSSASTHCRASPRWNG